MDKCSVLICGCLLLLSSSALSQQYTKTQTTNFNIFQRFCQSPSRNAQSISDVFRPICQDISATECCNNISEQIKRNPNLYLCSVNANFYSFTSECKLPTVSSSIVFRDDDGQVETQDISSYTPRLNTANKSEYYSSQVVDSRGQLPPAPVWPQQPDVQRQPSTFSFNFGNPQDIVRVPIASQGSSQNNGLNKPTKFNQGSNYQPNSNSNKENDDYDDDRVVVETGTAGYQAMEFALNLFKNLERPANSDSLISPLLPQLLLSSLVDYSSQKAQAQLKKTILLHPNQLANIASKLDRISKSTVNTIETASANFVAHNVNLNRTYASDVSTRDVEVMCVDFTQPNMAAHTANKWVSRKTHNLINEILNPSAISQYMRLLLANTIYFKGTWKYSFIKTSPGMFESSPNRQRQISKMFQLNKLRYGELKFNDGNGLRWVELPYEGDSLAMLVFLPTVRHQLEASLRQLKPYDLAKVMAELQSSYINTKVHLHMPKFTLTDSVSLIPALQRMGLQSIFQDPEALLYLTNEPTLVSDVTQRSYMSVDEFGTKATSVASLSIVTLSITPQYKDVKFDVDQPFLTMVIDKQERYPFFIGQINDPSE